MGIADRLAAALQKTRHVASNPYFVLFMEEAERIDRQALALPWMSAELCKLVTTVEDSVRFEEIILDGDLSTEFFQKLGELHVATVLAEKQIEIRKIPEESKSTPDFAVDHNGNKLYLEIKTFGFVDGGRAINETLYGSLEANYSIERQIKNGARVAIAEHAVSPLQNKTPDIPEPLRSIRVLIDKARQNIKGSQFALPNTFLVLNVVGLGIPAEESEFRPVVKGSETGFSSGRFWMTAFGEMETPIFCLPEFEGKPGIAGRLDRLGVLHERSEIAGLLVLGKSLSKPAQIGALIRSETVAGDDENSEVAMPFIIGAVQSLWNDELDTNGWAV
jgi:hypothetical protein